MGDFAASSHIPHPAFCSSEEELVDVAYLVCSHADGLDEALELMDMLDVPVASVRAARQEIDDHATGQCPPEGHRGRSCWKYWPVTS